MGLGVDRFRRINGEYRINDRIAKGNFCDVYRVKDRYGNPRAAKFTSIDDRFVLLRESKAMQESDGSRQHGALYWYYYGRHGNHYVLVMDLLGESLHMLKNKYGHLSTTTVLTLGIQMIGLMEALHGRGIVHRDIKPANFLIGKHGADRERVYLIGFKHSTLYRDYRGEHKPICRDPQTFGSKDFASRHAHWGLTHSRRSDLESLIYTIIYLIRGLPWGMLDESDFSDAGKIKEEMTKEELCRGLPEEIQMFYHDVANMEYVVKPDYTKLRGYLTSAMDTIGFVLNGVPSIATLKYLITKNVQE